MSQIRTPPSGRVAIGAIQLPSGPVEIYLSTEWARYFEALNNLTNQTATGPGGVADINADDTWHDDLNAREAVQGVDELRNEISTLRGENGGLRQALEELSATVAELRSADSLRLRVEQIEGRLL